LFARFHVNSWGSTVQISVDDPNTYLPNQDDLNLDKYHVACRARQLVTLIEPQPLHCTLLQNPTISDLKSIIRKALQKMA
jgi:hypothetical protein